MGDMAKELLVALLFAAAAPAGASECTQDTRGTCRFFSCSGYRNAAYCSSDGRCMCRSDQCAEQGACFDQGRNNPPPLAMTMSSAESSTHMVSVGHIVAV